MSDIGSTSGRHRLTLAAFLLTCIAAFHTVKGSHMLGSLEGSGGCYAVFSGDGNRVLTGDAEAARIWDARSLAALTLPLKHGEKITHLLWTADDTQVATIGGREVRFWDSKTGRLIHTITQDQHVGPAAIAADGKWVIAAGGGGRAVLWETETGRKVRTFEDRSPLCWAAFSFDGMKLLTFNLDVTKRLLGGGILHVRDVKTGRDLIPALKTTYEGGGHCPAEISPDGKSIIVGSAKGFEVYQIDGFRKIAQKTTGDEFGVDAGYTEMVHFTSDGKRVIWVIDVGVQVFDAGSGQPLGKVADVLAARAQDLAYSRAGTALLVAGLKDYAGIWSVANGKRIETFGDDFSSCVAMSSAQTRIAIGRTYPPNDEHGYTEVWDVNKAILPQP